MEVQLKTYYAPKELAGYSEASECKPMYQPCHNGSLLIAPPVISMQLILTYDHHTYFQHL